MKNIYQYTDYQQDITEKTQVCVIGTGCGGASVAKKLTDFGKNVILVEQGAYVPNFEMDQNELNMLGKLYAERGMEVSDDAGCTLLYGNSVGGASVQYWADSYRLPSEKIKRWKEEYFIQGHGKERLDFAFSELEELLNIHPAKDDYFNEMNTTLMNAGNALGWHGHRVPQARKNCLKSGHCMQGCVYGAKQSQLVTQIPLALQKSAKLYADAKAEKIHFNGNKAEYLEVTLLDRPSNTPSGKKMKIFADVFVVAAGGFNSSYFLMQQDLPEKLPALGKYFSMNPSTQVHAMYDKEIIMWRNIPAAWGIDHFRLAETENKVYKEGGYLLMANQLQLATFMTTLPGFADENAPWVTNFKNVGGTISWIDDIEDELGEIQQTLTGGKKVHYPYGEQTKKVLKDSILKQIQLHFKAGAKEIVISGHQNIRMKSMDEIHKLNDLVIEAGGLVLAAPHPAGGCRMGKTREDAVVDSKHKIFGTDNVYVSDSSVFPTSTSLDPSLTIMAYSYIAAQEIADR